MTHMWVVTIRVEDVAAVVCRAIIKKYQFKVGITLCQNAIYAFTKERRMIVVRYYD